MRKGPAPRDVGERILASVVADEQTGCWEWKLTRDRKGYARMRVGSVVDGTRRTALASRVSFERFVGPIPAGLEVDHRCKNPCCVNPGHLEAVTHAENILRSEAPPGINGRKNVCASGHAMTFPNTYRRPDGGRDCRTCRRERRLTRIS